MPLIDLRLPDLTTNLGVGPGPVRLAWRLADARPGAGLSWHRVLVASSPERLVPGAADRWDSGVIGGDADHHQAMYAGPALASGERVWWTVLAGDDQGQPMRAEPAWWEAGLQSRGEWQASWIGGEARGSAWLPAPCPYLRRSFTVPADARRARLYLTALGVYEATLDGLPVGDDVLMPGWTDFRRRVRARTYDLTGRLGAGDHVLGVILGDGWYCGQLEKRSRQLYGERPLLLARLDIDLNDGTRSVIVSDISWQFASGGLIGSDLIAGEHFDARRHPAGWDKPGGERIAGPLWRSAVVATDPGIAVEADAFPVPKRQGEIPAVADPVQVGRTWIVDLGQNLAGRVRLRLSGAQPGRTLRLRHGEMREADGRLHLANLRTAVATDSYTCRGGDEVWEPRFTHHGFRYVEVVDWAGPLPREAVSGVQVHSELPEVGRFSCSAPLVDRLQRNIVWGMHGNFLDVPTDCPQRDERLGWLGDAQVFASTALFNADAAPFYRKWLADVRDTQNAAGAIPGLAPTSHLPGDWGDGGPGWADATIIIPWEIHLATGDTGILAEHWPSLERWFAQQVATSRDGVRAFVGAPSRGYGDWLALDGSDGTKDSRGATPLDLIGTAYFAHSAGLMARIAAVLGHADAAGQANAVRDQAVSAFRRDYLDERGVLHAATQTASVLALAFDLLTPAQADAAGAWLVADIRKRGTRLTTGFLGTPHLLPVLSKLGESDLAYALLLRQEHPSWLFPVVNGATTIWERRDGWTPERGFQDPGMNSFNHYAFGAVGAWLYQHAAGIAPDPELPGYRRIRLRPQPGPGLEWAKAEHRSPYGQIMSHWWREGAGWAWEATVPPGSSAIATLPLGPGQRVVAPPDARPLPSQPHRLSFSLVSGSHRFAVVS